MTPERPVPDRAPAMDPAEAERVRLRAEIALRDRQLAALRRGVRAILRHQGFEGAARAVFDYCRELTGATWGYVAWLAEDGRADEELYLEPGTPPCAADSALPAPLRGLRGRAYAERRAVYQNEREASEEPCRVPPGQVALRNALFAPLMLDDRVVGLIGLANKPTDLGADDASIATGLSEWAAIALQNGRQRDACERTAHVRPAALDHVQRRSGLLTICASCKRVLDDQGAWEDVEVYLREHAEIEFTHGLCPQCMAELDPSGPVGS